MSTLPVPNHTCGTCTSTMTEKGTMLPDGTLQCAARAARTAAPFCPGCDQLLGIKEYDAKLWDLYHRIDDGRQHREALVYTQDDLEEAGFYDDEEARESVMHSMERSMHSRGLCTTCGRPSMAGIDPSRILSEEDAQDQAEMYAEQAAERRAGA